MTGRVDLNADLGEGFGPWKMGQDTALLDVVTSANIACGFHAGDPDTMARTMAMAVARGVGLGCHPGFEDLRGFGRRRMRLSAAELTNLVVYQLGAAQAMARAAGSDLRHFKLHGALANMCAEDVELARVCYRAVSAVVPGLRLVVLARTAQEAAAQEVGLPWRGEILADRAYNDDATPMDRALPGAVVHDGARAGRRVSQMLRSGAIISESGKRIPARIDTVCLHGDTEDAVELAKSVRSALGADGLDIRAFD